MDQEKNGKVKAPAVVMPIEDVLDLHTFRPKEVPQLLEDYLEACWQSDIFSVRIIHGKGKGILKDLVWRSLKKMPRVETFANAPHGAGGWGATIVELKKKDMAEA